MTDRPEGAVLVGGASRRMGRDKAGLAIAGRSMAEHVASALEPVVGALRLVGGPEAPGWTSRPWLPDARPGDGPLAGIHSALLACAASRVLVVACDLPLVTPAFLAALDELLTPEVDAVVPSGDAGPVPVCAVYRASTVHAAEARLRKDDRSARDFAASLRCRYVSGSDLAAIDPSGQCLENVNTPEEHRRAERLLADSRPGPS